MVRKLVVWRFLDEDEAGRSAGRAFYVHVSRTMLLAGRSSSKRKTIAAPWKGPTNVAPWHRWPLRIGEARPRYP